MGSALASNQSHTYTPVSTVSIIPRETIPTKIPSNTSQIINSLP